MKRLLLLFLILPFMACANGEVRVEKKPIPKVITGAENLLLSTDFWQKIEGKQIGIVSNQTSIVGPNKVHLVDTLLARGIKIKTIFCPEHGFRGQAEAGAVIASGVDRQTGLPVVSLYGANKKPLPNQMKGLDVMLFDLQDVGCRFYTYISTLHYVMEACAEAGVPLMVLDRPNPNGHYVDGPVLEPQYQSFVGMHPVPIVYGMTIGEYALMIKGERWLWMTSKANQWVRKYSDEEYDSRSLLMLSVVPLVNYTHNTRYKLPVAPSPNLQTSQSISLYPHLCLFEGTNISVGRGTDSPFEMVGSPSYKATTNDLPDSVNRNFQFTPRCIKGVSENPPFKGQVCKGIDLRKVKAANKFDLTYILEMYQATPKTNFFMRNNFFDKLAGTASLRLQIGLGQSEKQIRESWASKLIEFNKIRSKYLLYP